MKIKSALLSLIALTAAFPLLAQRCLAGQNIVGESGQMFMEETTPPPPAASQQKRVPIDLSNVGVPVDERGRIVPLIDRSSPDGVRRNFSNFESYSTPPVIAVPAYPYFSPWGGYSPYSYGYRPPYGYGGPYGYGSPFGSPYGYGGNGFGFNLGRLRVNLGTPGYGYNGMYGANPWGFGSSPFAGNPWSMGGSPWGFGGNQIGVGSPWNYGNPYRFGNPYAMVNPYGGMGGNGLFGPSPFPIYSSPLLGSSLFDGNVGGLGLSIFTPPKIEFQSSGTITPITPNLDTTDQP